MSTNFKQAALESIAARSLYLLTRLALPPLVLAHIGLAEYGIWSIAFVLVGYLGLSVSGLAIVYVREIAIAQQRNDAAYASHMLSTGVFLALIIGGTFCVTLSLLLPLIMTLFDVSVALRPLAAQIFIATCLVFLADLTLGAWGYVLNGLKLIHVQQRIWVAAFMVEWLAVAVLLPLGFGMQGLIGAFALRYALSIALAWHYAHKAWPELRLSLRFISPSHLPQFLRLGLGSQISDSWAMLLHSGDRLISAASFGSLATALLDLGNKLPSTAVSVGSGINQALIPHVATARLEDKIALYKQGLHLNLVTLLSFMPLLVAMTPGLLVAWLGPRPELTTLIWIMLWSTPAWHLHMLTGTASSTLRAQGSLQLEFLYHLLRTTGLLIVWWVSDEITAFTAGAAAALGGSAIIYLLVASRRVGLAVGTIAREILRPLSVCYVAAYLLAFNWPWHLDSRTDAIHSLMQMCCVLVLPWGLAIWHGFLEEGDRKQLRRLVEQFRRKELKNV